MTEYQVWSEPAFIVSIQGR